MKEEIRSNTYNPQTGDLVVSPARAEAFQAVSAHYAALFGDEPALQKTRKACAIPPGSIKTPERRRLINTSFFWAAWACGTDRPGSRITYTQNWPPESLIDNRPTGSVVVWSVISFVVLLAGTGPMEKLRWLRVIGDTIFALGAVTLGWFVLGLKTGWSLDCTRGAEKK